MTEWQPIETAPKDGTEFLACATWKHKNGSYAYLWVADGYLDGQNNWYFSGFALDEWDYTRPTHWMPLFAPPGDAP